MRMFQINEDDLADLERTLPSLCDALYPAMADKEGANKIRVMLRRVKEITSNVRWNYGPPQQVKIIPADGLPPEE